MTATLESQSSFPTTPEVLPDRTCQAGHYRASFAQTLEDLDAIQRLRFEVFNLELGEGLEESFASGRDIDEFDPVCHHLVVKDVRTNAVVGCYRMQTASMAEAHAGFYSASLFDISSLPEEVVASAVEVGRACVAREHRSKHVLFLLWKGLAMYVAHNHLRFLFGCCSLTSQNPAEAWAVMRFLERNDHVHGELRASPNRKYAIGVVEPSDRDIESAELPILFKTYLRYGSKVCSTPAIDRQFKTIDYLVLLDVDALSPRTRQVFFD